MRAQVCAKCGTPRQWAMWTRCVCGGEFIECDVQATTPLADEPSAEDLWLKQVHWEFRYARWTSPALFAGALLFTLYFPPPLIAAAVVLAISGVASAYRIYGTLLARMWSVPGPFYIMFAYLPVSFADKAISMNEGQYAALLFTSLFLMNLPFFVWRRKGLLICHARLSNQPTSDKLRS